MAPMMLTSLVIAYAIFMGAAIDMANLMLHKSRTMTAANAACQAGAVDLAWVANQGTTNALTNYESSATGFPMSSSSGTVSGDCASASASVAMCAYAKANGYDPSVSGNDVSWTVSNVLSPQQTINPNKLGGEKSFATPQSAAQVSTSNGVLPFLRVAVTEKVPTYLLSIMPWFHSPLTVTGTCNCGLSSSGTQYQEAAPNVNQFCAFNSSGSIVCATSPVVSGHYSNWTWLGSSLWRDSEDYPVPADMPSPAVPQSGTQAFLSNACASPGGTSGKGGVPCATGILISPSIWFPDIAVSASTPITLNISGESLVASGGGGGGWVNLTCGSGTGSGEYAYVGHGWTFYGGGETWGNYDGTWGGGTDPDFTSDQPGQAFDPRVNGDVITGAGPASVGSYIQAGSGSSGLATATCLGVTNLNQISVSTTSKVGGHYVAFVWASWGGSSTLRVTTFSNN